MASTGDESEVPDRAAVDLALAQTFHAVDAQAARLADFRARTTTLLGAVTIGASFAAVVRAESGSLDAQPCLGIAALVAFAAQLVCTLVVLFPVKRLALSRSPKWLHARAVKKSMSFAELSVQLLADASKAHDGNNSKIDTIGRWYTAALLAFALAVGLSAAALLIGG